MKSNLEAPTSEDFKDISKMISQDNHKSEQKKQKEVEKVAFMRQAYRDNKVG